MPPEPLCCSPVQQAKLPEFIGTLAVGIDYAQGTNCEMMCSDLIYRLSHHGHAGGAIRSSSRAHT
jgi:hypothetical protein